MLHEKWNRDFHILRVFDSVRMAGGEARFVGGCVRDYMLDRFPKDIDIATTLDPQRFMEVNTGRRFRFTPESLRHGSLQVVNDEITYEITTLRKDLVTDGRHAKVAFTKSWREDSQRRDFTINALYMNRDERIYDYHSGKDDIQARIVKFIGDPETRVKQDHLRIMRYFRFYSYLGGQNIDEASLKACSTMADSLLDVSAERITAEMLIILSSVYVTESIALMEQSGVLSKILPNTSGKNLKFSRDKLINLAALLYKNQESINNLKLSNQDTNTLNILWNNLLTEHSRKSDHIRVYYNFGKTLYEMILQFSAVLGMEVHNLITKPLPIFPVSAHDIIKLGFRGAQIREMLEKLENKWLCSECTTSKEELLESILQT